jgi:hypothetical protein
MLTLRAEGSRKGDKGADLKDSAGSEVLHHQAPTHRQLLLLGAELVCVCEVVIRPSRFPFLHRDIDEAARNLILFVDSFDPALALDLPGPQHIILRCGLDEGFGDFLAHLGVAEDLFGDLAASAWSWTNSLCCSMAIS